MSPVVIYNRITNNFMGVFAPFWPPKPTIQQPGQHFILGSHGNNQHQIIAKIRGKCPFFQIIMIFYASDARSVAILSPNPSELDF